MNEVRYGATTFVLAKGDITEQVVDVIVNAANGSLLGGGGVDGAIHRKGGPAILEECKQILTRQGGCPTGEAVITGAGRLQAKHVVHTVGPVWPGDGADEQEVKEVEALLASCYRNSLRLAASVGAKTPGHLPRRCRSSGRMAAYLSSGVKAVSQSVFAGAAPDARSASYRLLMPAECG